MEAELAPIIAAVGAMAAGWGYLEVLKRRLIKSRSVKKSTPNAPSSATEYVIVRGSSGTPVSTGVSIKSATTFADITGGKGGVLAKSIRRPPEIKTP